MNDAEDVSECIYLAYDVPASKYALSGVIGKKSQEMKRMVVATVSRR